MMAIKKIISGGQTGVDRAALDSAQKNHIPSGGWCPKGRKAEDGVLPDRYPLTETPIEQYEQRTEWNVRDSDGTLILGLGVLEGGTALTKVYAENLKKPVLVIDLKKPVDLKIFKDWIKKNNIQVLNIAGPRESKQPGIYNLATTVLDNLFKRNQIPQKKV
ncbi:MAG: putative molybdenum carrier protein [Elusimicrobia bacterium]|nr:putative molybdenum carrier protein [Candidatus Obscuribacterium magneticum]